MPSTDMGGLPPLGPVGEYQGNQRVKTENLTDDANIIIDARRSNNFRLLLGGNRTIQRPLFLYDGMVLNLLIVQDGTGSRTLTWNSVFYFTNNSTPALSTTAGAIDVFSFVYSLPDDKLIGGLAQSINSLVNFSSVRAGIGTGIADDGSGAMQVLGSISRPVSTITASTYSITTLDQVILVDATSNNVTLTLPAANSWSSNSQTRSSQLIIKRIDSSTNTVTVNTSGSDTVEGVSSITLAALGGQILETSSSTKWFSTGKSGGGSGTKTLACLTPAFSQPPSSNFATLDTRNNLAVLVFDDTTDESVFWSMVVPEGTNLTSGLNFYIHWYGATATTGNAKFGISIERMNTDIDADSFATEVTAFSVTNGTSGIETVTTITVTSANLDGAVAGDMIRVQLFRRPSDTTNDTMTGYAQVHAVEVRSAATT